MRTTPVFRALALLGVALVSSSAPAAEISRADYINKVKGGWAGQMIGVSFGSIYEFKAQGHTIEGPLREWEPQFIENAIHQDDLYVEMTFLEAIVDYGLDVTHGEAGKAFGDSQYPLWHANKAGRDNVRAGIMPPLSGDPDHNEHFDDIDFQIEADLFGLITPGMPQACNALCDIFGHVMNYGDGVYGGIWVAAMYSLAYFEDDVHTLVEEALGTIPAESTYAQLVRDVIAQHDEDPEDWLAAWTMLEGKWAPGDLCPGGRGTPFNIDAKLNGGYIAIGLLYGDGDMDRTLEICTRCGQDADCNPSNAAGVLGTVLGYDGIPEEYTANIPNVADDKFSHTSYSFNSLAELCADVVEEIVVHDGGSLEGRGDKAVWQIREQGPEPAPLEQFVHVDNARLTATSTREGIGLAWEAIPGARRIAIARRPVGGGVWQRVGGVGGDETRFLDRRVQPGQVFEYTLRPELAVRGSASSTPVRGFVFDPKADNEPSDKNLARLLCAWADAAILTPLGGGLKDIEAIRNGVREENYDSFDGNNEAPEDWYGIRFAKALRVNEVVYVEGKSFHDGGWWTELRPQFLDADGEWRDVADAAMEPRYNFADAIEGREAYTAYTFAFPMIECAGIRVLGKPGGEADFTSIGELEVYCRR